MMLRCSRLPTHLIDLTSTPNPWSICLSKRWIQLSSTCERQRRRRTRLIELETGNHLERPKGVPLAFAFDIVNRSSNNHPLVC